MNKYIIEILKIQSSVILPAFCSLMVANSKTGKVVFNPHLKFNDGALSKFSSEKEGIDAQEAQNQVAKCVREIEAELGKGNSYDMVEFGSFKKDSDGTISFDMDPKGAVVTEGTSTKKEAPKAATTETSKKDVKAEEKADPVLDKKAAKAKAKEDKAAEKATAVEDKAADKAKIEADKVAEKAKIQGFYPELVVPKALEIGPKIQETLSKAYKKGVKIAFGTDDGVFKHGDNGKEFGCMVEAGMPAMEAIQSATITSAKILGIDNELGEIKAGYLADIIAVNENPIENIKTLEKAFFLYLM